VSDITRLDETDPRFPCRLRELPDPPTAIWVRGSLALRRVFAVVGSRSPIPEASAFAAELSRAIVGAGGVLASGGATGIDAAAHRGALEAGGPTWVVAGTGLLNAYPDEHQGLFDEVVRGGGALLSVFPPEAKATRTSFLERNGLLAALAEAVVVVQAGLPSGALSTASWAKRLARPLYVVTFPPWAGKGFEGSAVELRAGARPLVSVDAFLRDARLARPAEKKGGRAQKSPSRELTKEELALLAALEFSPLHTDEIAARISKASPNTSPNAGPDTGELSNEVSSRTVAWALLTLALENVVVEGPTGFFRRI
jgi:DNA processing protein